MMMGWIDTIEDDTVDTGWKRSKHRAATRRLRAGVRVSAGTFVTMTRTQALSIF